MTVKLAAVHVAPGLSVLYELIQLFEDHFIGSSTQHAWSHFQIFAAIALPIVPITMILKILSVTCRVDRYVTALAKDEHNLHPVRLL